MIQKPLWACRLHSSEYQSCLPGPTDLEDNTPYFCSQIKSLWPFGGRNVKHMFACHLRLRVWDMSVHNLGDALGLEEIWKSSKFLKVGLGTVDGVQEVRQQVLVCRESGGQQAQGHQADDVGACGRADSPCQGPTTTGEGTQSRGQATNSDSTVPPGALSSRNMLCPPLESVSFTAHWATRCTSLLGAAPLFCFTMQCPSVVLPLANIQKVQEVARVVPAM